MDIIEPTPELLEERYNLYNKTLFNNSLMECVFAIRNLGSKTLGCFYFETGNRLFVSKSNNGKMYYQNLGEKIWIDKNNFVQYCNPHIALNSNYKWTLDGVDDTLVHEMCHYYTYMHGWSPKQAHGIEFRDIGMVVSSRSNGRFSIKRLASSEDMKKVELNPEIQAQKDKMLKARLKNSVVMLIYFNTGKVFMVHSFNLKTAYNIIEQLKKYSPKNNVDYVLTCPEDSLKQLLFDNKYKSMSYKYRGWYIQDTEFLKKIENGHFNFNRININSELDADKKLSTAVQKTPEEKEPPKITPNDIIPHFRIKTTQGRVIEFENVHEGELMALLHDKFPNWSAETIKNIVLNPKYRIK